METKSPFSISREDVTALKHDAGFKVVQAYLSNQENHPFCSSHSSLAQTSQRTFILHRDILHSLLLPLLQIRSQAAVFAAHTLSYRRQTRQPPSPASPRSAVDLELAFRGAARGAFSWLQCFVTEERDWCSTRGCPACVVLKILHAEPFIRIVVASCRLSTYLRDLLQERQQQQQDIGRGERNIHHTPRTDLSAALPEFGFWLSAVHQAVSEDEFWGLHFWEDIEARAEHLELGVKDLIRQCCAGICPSPSPAPSPSPSPTTTASPAAYQRRALTFGPMMPFTTGRPAAVAVAPPPPPLKTGEIVKRQLRLQREEQQWMRRIIQACWSALVREAAVQRRKVSAGVGLGLRPAAVRTRSLTT